MDSIVFVLGLNGAAEHYVFRPDGTQVYVKTDDIADAAILFADSYENYSIKLVGNKEYAEGFKEMIEEKEARLYGFNKLDIEIVGGQNE